MSTISKSCVDFANDYPRSDVEAMCCGGCHSSGYPKIDEEIGEWEYQGIRSILFQMRLEKWSSSNIVFGSGGGLLQKVNRDTQRFAFKSSAQERNGVWHDIFKAPRDCSKNSKRGRLALVRDDNGFSTVMRNDMNGRTDLLETVFENGNILRYQTFEDVRKNAEL